MFLPIVLDKKTLIDRTVKNQTCHPGWSFVRLIVLKVTPGYIELCLLLMKCDLFLSLDFTHLSFCPRSQRGQPALGQGEQKEKDLASPVPVSRLHRCHFTSSFHPYIQQLVQPCIYCIRIYLKDSPLMSRFAQCQSLLYLFRLLFNHSLFLLSIM